MKEEMKEDQEKLIQELKSQHNEKMEKEGKRLELMAKLIDKLN